MTIVKLDVVVGLAVSDDQDHEEVVASFNRGLTRALDPFPDAEVIDATVESASKPDPGELRDRGWEDIDDARER